MTYRTETIVARVCGVLALSLAGLAMLPRETEAAKRGGSMPKLSWRMLWPSAKGRASARPAPATKTQGQEGQGQIIYDPTPAFIAQQKKREDIKNRPKTLKK